MSLIFCFVTAGYVSAQDQQPKKKVAVYVSGGKKIPENIKKVLGAKMVSAITKSGDYSAVERSAYFLAALGEENDYQVSGEVRDSQIAKLGDKLGVKYVMVVDVTESFDEYFLDGRVINVETGLVDKADNVYGQLESTQNIVKYADELAAKLLGAGSSLGTGTTGSRTQAGSVVEKFTVNGVTFEMVRVEGGTYQMGSWSGDSDEQPVHSETVGTFYIGRTEVTQRLWAAVMGNNPSKFRGENNPVESVSWYDCQEFVERLSRMTGRTFRLPTEAEWEYAARGGNRSRGYLYSGSENLSSVGWYDGNSGSMTHPVGQKLDNELGIFDMSGNVYEWCQDCWRSNYNASTNCSFRVLRGGGWGNTATGCRVANRDNNSPDGRYGTFGMRLAL